MRTIPWDSSWNCWIGCRKAKYRTWYICWECLRHGQRPQRIATDAGRPEWFHFFPGPGVLPGPGTFLYYGIWFPEHKNSRKLLILRRTSHVSGCFYLLRITGLEPARRGHQNLNLARLPIPPHPLNPLCIISFRSFYVNPSILPFFVILECRWIALVWRKMLLPEKTMPVYVK